jgi:outer membrane receptor protein involved in Fe transport
VQGVLYYSNLNQRLTNGVTVDAATCADGSGNLCTNGGTGSYLTGLNGQPINDFLNGGSYGGVSYQGTDSNAWGASAQITNTHDVFGLANHAVAGVSYDGGNSTFTGSQTIGFLNPQRFVGPPEVVIDQADLSIAPVRLNTTNNYYGVFFSDMLSLTDKLTLSLSGRFNAANIALHDDVNLALNGTHNFTHFNPGVGATYAVTNDVAVYASYAVSNRAPTPSELSCANPGTPCQLPNFFIGDPNLKQVVAGTIEFGVRGKFADVLGAKGFWNIDLYRSNSNDDIIYEASPVNNNAGFYSNAGTTRRQGIEANLTLTRGALRATLGYALVNATFQSPLILSSPNNPAADVNGLIYVNPGNKIPGIPENRVKLIVDYAITDKWTVGGSGIFASSQYLFGDEANQNSQLPGYFVLTLNTSYQVTDHIALFGLVNNVFDRKYETYGTYAQVIGLPAPELPGGSVTTSRVASPAPPIAGFGGVRIIF